LPNFLNRNTKWRYIAIAGIFFMILTGIRLFWIASFHNPDQPHAVHGQLDLRNWEDWDSRTLTLDGEWEFYPHTWLIGGERGAAPGQPDWIQVPGGWNDSLQPGSSTPYGYATYRLRILVSPEQERNYSIRIPSVRSSSALYVNGRLLSASGQPGESAETYVAYNVPYSSSFTANGGSVIEVVIQAANYKDPRGSGIVRSIKFGTEERMARETLLSISMQQIAAVVFLIHAVYALILYLVGRRDRRLIAFSLLLVSAMFMYLLGSDEKLLSYWLPINYEFSFKLVHFAMITAAYALLQCIKHQLTAFWRKWVPWLSAFCGAAALLSLLLPARYVVTIQFIYSLGIGVSMLFTILSMLRTSIKEPKDNVLLLLSVIAFMSNLLWWGILMTTGIKVVYYPFDLIASIACFASVWFRHYFQVHAETEQLAAKLQRADKRKDEFLANTSHELRNPLHGILNLSHAVLEREQPSLNRKSVKDLKTVLTVGRRMSIMLNDLLDAMSLQESGPRLQLRSIKLQPIVTGVTDMLHPMTEGKPVRIVNQIPEHFPNVYADENRVIQIVFNLLHNALKFTNEGEVTIRGEVKHGKARIAIADTGIGMDEETRQRVFEPYEQADSAKTMIEGGFGLGLSISKQLVELHGGTLRVRSAPGQGSEFVFTLQLAGQAESLDVKAKESTESAVPAAAVAAPSSPPLWMEQTLTGAASADDRPNLLVVDDDPVNLEVVETILSSDLYAITSVTSGKQALAALDAKEWDLVITDVMMPHMSGYELTRVIRGRFSVTDLPVLLLTARSRPEDIRYGFQAGANDYVTKPVDALELRARVQMLTEIKQSMRERIRMETAWLQAQIQPHFIFNTLNSISALSLIDLKRMRDMLEAFGDVIRSKIKFRDELVPIEEELNIVRAYLHIEKERFDDRLQVQWEISECGRLMIPLLTIQPLVENAVRHGVMKRTRGGTITIRLTDTGTHALIVIADDGVGIEEEIMQRLSGHPSEPDRGIGISNTHLRLKRYYGKGLDIQSAPDRGTSVSFSVPYLPAGFRKRNR